MKHRAFSRLVRQVPPLALVLSALNSCAPDASDPVAIRLQAAKPTSGGPTVTATEPNAAPQNSTLQVRVFGSGFDNGSAVSFAIAGVTSSKVVATTTSFVSSTELLANVSVAADADTVSYDVVVLTSSGKKGIGSELFLVSGDPPTTWFVPLTNSGLAVTADGKYLNGEYSEYEDRVCGVYSKIFASDAASESGDAIVQTDRKQSADRKCPSYPRKITFHYPDGATETTVWRANVQYLQTSAPGIPIGTTVKRALNVNSSGSASRCAVLKFRPIDNTGAVIGGDSVLVTRVNSFTWEVQTQAAPNNRAYCANLGVLYNMPLRFRIEAAWGLP
jgi:hypothetical protein